MFCATARLGNVLIYITCQDKIFATWSQSRSAMETNNFDFARYVYRTTDSRDNTLDDAQLEKCCPLDNGRHDCTPISTSFATNQLFRLPVELVIEILLQLDIPSLTRFRSLNRRAMQLVNSVRQYAAIIKHCPNIIRAIVSIQADAFDCATLYRTLCTTRCSTCNRFGDRLYLIDCRRVCFFCFIERPEYFPVTHHEAHRLFTSNAKSQKNLQSFHQLFKLANPPSILSLPGRYSARERNLRQRRLRLYDRQAVVRSLLGSGLPRWGETTGKTKRYMAIITAPVLLSGGQQVDYGFFCRGCRDEVDRLNMHPKIKYMAEEIPGHIAKYGRIVERKPWAYGRFLHVKSDLYRQLVSQLGS